MTNLLDNDLMAGIAAEDANALAAFYDRHGPRVFALCLRALRDRAEAEDLTLEIFWELWRRSARYDGSRALPLTYLLRVTRSRVIDRLRARRIREGLETGGLADGDGFAGDGACDDGNPGPLDRALLSEQQLLVGNALSALSPEQRTAIDMAFFDAMSHSEIAERLGEPLGTIKSRIRQALARLREALTPTQGERARMRETPREQSA